MRKSGPPKGLISYLALELLDEKPRYGYELLKEITDLSGGHWEPSYGSVYPILYNFEDEGYAERIEREDEPDRKYFQLTDTGREKLAEKRVEVGGKSGDFADVILGFYHLYAAVATDERFEADPGPTGEWAFDEVHSAWIVEQIIRHHERDFGEFERIDLTPEEFREQYGSGEDGADGGDDATTGGADEAATGDGSDAATDGDDDATKSDGGTVGGEATDAA